MFYVLYNLTKEEREGQSCFAEFQSEETLFPWLQKNFETISIHKILQDAKELGVKYTIELCPVAPSPEPEKKEKPQGIKEPGRKCSECGGKIAPWNKSGKCSSCQQSKKKLKK